MAKPDNALPDSELALRISKLWPHREHESPVLLGLLCRLGLHRWRRLELSGLIPGRDICFCFWCSKVRIDGVVHEI